MTKFLLSLHVLAAIIAVGPVTVAASMFPAVARRGDTAALRTLHRICRVYAAFGVVVPVFGLATASSLGVLTDAWLLVSIALTAAAAAVLGLAVLPGQAAVLASSRPTGAADRAAALAASPTDDDAIARSDASSVDSTTAPATSDRPGVPAHATSDGGAGAWAGAADADAGGWTDATGGGVGARVARLGMVTGVFNLLWAVVVVLMIVRPGSTTGA